MTIPDELVAELDQKALLPVAQLDDPFYVFLESVTMRTTWVRETEVVTLYVTVKRTPGMNTCFKWEIERDCEPDSDYRDIVGYSAHDEFLSAIQAYQNAIGTIEVQLNFQAIERNGGNP